MKYPKPDKATWMFIFMLVVLTLSITLTSAELIKIDNVKSYDADTRTVVVENLFGLGEDLLSARLISDLDVVVPPTYTNVSMFEVKGLKDYSDFLNEIEYFDIKKNNKKIDRNVDLMMWEDVEVNDYEYVCSDGMYFNGTKYPYDCFNKLIGTHVEKGWKELTKKDIKKDETIIIGIFTNVENGEKTEWIPKLAGVKVEEWASWEGSLKAGLAGCWDLDEASGTVIDYSPGQLNNGTNNGADTGVTSPIASLGDGYFFAPGTTDNVSAADSASLDITGNLTIGIVYNISSDNQFFAKGGITDTRHWLIATSSGTLHGEVYESGYYNTLYGTSDTRGNSATFGVFTVDATHGNMSIWVDGSYENTIAGPNTLETNNYELYIGKILGGDAIGGDGVYVFDAWVMNYTMTASDISTIWNGGNVISCSTEPDPTPFVDLIAPANETVIYSPSIDLECNAYDDSGITNVSLLWDGTAEQTNSSGYNATNYNFTKTGFAIGTYEWSCEAYNDANQINNTSPAFHITYANDLTITEDAPIDQFNTTSTTNYLNGTASDDTAVLNVSLYIDSTLNQTNSSPYNDTLTPFTVDLPDGSYNWSLEACDAVSCLFTAGRNITIDTDSPQITIYYPLTSMPFIKIGNNQTINWSITETAVGNISAHIAECTLDYDGSTLNITDVCTSTNSSSFNYTNGINTIVLNVTDIFGNTNSSTRSWSYDFVQTAESFNAKANETDNESFSLNLSIPATVDDISSFLSYNATTYAADTDCTGTDCYINASLDIPLLTSGDAYENKSFHWVITTLTDGSTSTLTTTAQNQNISQINLTKCGGNYQAVDFNISEEHDLKPLTANMDIKFDYWLGGGTVKKVENTALTAATNYTFCIIPNETYYSDVTIFLNASGGFESRNFDFIREVYTNSLRTQPLHLVNLTYETPSDIIIEVSDQGLVPKSDVLVNISRYFPDTNTYVQVESQLTDEFGQITAKLVENDVKYLFQFYDSDKNLLKTSDRVTIACRASICVLPFVLEGTVDSFDRFDSPELYSSTLTFDNTTNTVTFFWDDQTGDSITTTLEVVRYNFNASTTVCSNTSSSNLGTLICGVGDSKASYKAQAYRNDGSDNYRIALLDFKVGTNFSTYGFEGLLWVFILLFTALGIGAFNPSVAIGLFNIGFIAMGIIGIISMPLAVFFAVTIICILFIWGLNK